MWLDGTAKLKNTALPSGQIRYRSNAFTVTGVELINNEAKFLLWSYLGSWTVLAPNGNGSPCFTNYLSFY